MIYRQILTATLVSALTLGVAAASSLGISNASFESAGSCVVPSPTGTPTDPSAAPGIAYLDVGSVGCGWKKTPYSDSMGFMSPVAGGSASNSAVPSYSQYPNPSSPLIPEFVGPTFTNGVPDGNSLGYITYGFMYQVLLNNVQAGVTYTLQAYFGNRWDVDAAKLGFNNYPGNSGFFMELGAINGSELNPGTQDVNRTTLARTSYPTSYNASFFSAYPSVNAPDATPPAHGGEWKLISLTYTAQAGDPSIGKPLVIIFGSPAREADFDLVSLDATSSVPEPATFGFALSGLALVALKLRRK
jgi:hypothetical protein